MAATVFKNVNTVVAAGVTILCPTSVSVDYEGDLQEVTCGNNSFPEVSEKGARAVSITIEGTDVVSLYAASKASGVMTFKLAEDGDSALTASFDLGNAVGESMSFSTGDPGQTGSGSVTLRPYGTTDTITSA